MLITVFHIIAKDSFFPWKSNDWMIFQANYIYNNFGL